MSDLYDIFGQNQQLFCTDLGVENSHTRGMDKDSPVSEKLRQLRKRAGLTVRATAAALEMTPSTYGYYEQKSFKKAHLPWDLATKIADVFAKSGVDRSAVLSLAAEQDVAAGVVLASDTGTLADQLAEIVRMFTSIQDPDLRANRFEMVKVILATEENQPLTAQVSDRTAVRRS